MKARVVLVGLFAALMAHPVLCQENGGRVEALRREYAIVASNLVPSLRSEAPLPEASVEPAVLEAKERWRVITLQGVESSDHRIKGVAKEAAAAHAEILDIANTRPEGGDIVAGLALSLVLQNPGPLIRGAVREADKDGSYTDRYAAAVQRRRAATFLLPELAKELAGPESKGPVLSIDFDENWFGANLPDRLNLTNVTDTDLTGSTVQVDLRGRDGKWVRNVHFVPSWPRGQALFVDYLSSDPKDLAAISGTTGVEVQDVAVSIWCDQMKSEGIAMHYPGKARDEDRARQLEKLMVLTIDYVAKPFTEPGPSVGVTLGGVQRLQACKVILACHVANATDQILEQGLKSWEGGRRISLPSRGALQGCPESVDVTVKLDGSEVEWRKNVKVSARR